MLSKNETTLVSAGEPTSSEGVDFSDKIFLITKHFDYEGFTIIGIYEDLNKAIEEYYRIADDKREYGCGDEMILNYYTKNKNLDDEEPGHIIYTSYSSDGRIKGRHINMPRIKGISPFISTTVAPLE